MKTLDSKDLEGLIEAGHESRKIEFKTNFSWDNTDTTIWMRETVIQTILGLTNTIDGGDIVIGIEKRNGGLALIGVSEENIESFDYDTIKAQVDSFSSESTNFIILEGTSGGIKYIIIRVAEFEELPTICRKDGQKVMKKGDIYCRAKRGEPATIRATEVELREIIERAVDKGNKKLKARGYEPSGKPNSEELYKKELGEFDEQ